MPHVVTQSCCSDASCVYACPVNCIHPTPDEPDFLTAEMLHIDPAACVDCGACVSACPVDAIVPQKKLTESQQVFLSINADFYKDQDAGRARIGGTETRPALAKVTAAAEVSRDREPLRVAIIGSGPAAMYAADELLTQPGVAVNVFDRLPVPHGLVRAGVAPDHQKTKQVSRLYETIATQPGFEYYLNVEIGKHLTHDELLAHHHAVIYAVGASSDRKLGIDGEDLPGSTSATNFVAWYNGHPDHADDAFDLSHRRAVIIGNGNVALDVARVLTADPERLAETDISVNALAALRASKVEEVVIVARRGFAQSAFTVPEFAGLLSAPDVEVVIESDEAQLDAQTRHLLDKGELPHAVAQKLVQLEQIRERPAPAPGRKRIVLRYLLSPTAILGDNHVTGIEFARNEFVVGDDGAVRVKATESTEKVDAGLVLTSIGYRGVPIDGVPFDDAVGVIPNTDGRVLDAPGGSTLTGAYVTGWIKRGPTGFIGTNKSCAQQTVGQLVDDFNTGRLTTPRADNSALDRLVRERRAAVIDRAGWRSIDEAERQRGARAHRVREKITDEAELVALAATTNQVESRPRFRRKLRS
ncbi:FAD-dependent oxidoreductase [Rhodococcus triatomae]|uniref:ferredoxin--NADP(+) reductase n=1 Tax=Rhodococcus triatomae TaxID=300028 RepID=A0A1G8L7R4_9NOCA|nr:FAD-dependent oxidoreductase [Rhodococcus triatomae]QNG20527.1 FAD-dependent oxidoreductase [Rhodococcus triatomae]QNG23555.1 FAD-dependent oxidoreductase [Rhodococcus triatomae]SDI51749.1 ferredoxin--NADP+ reductase [Rhodococcus triatomae]